jgi:hypothetical protein
MRVECIHFFYGFSVLCSTSARAPLTTPFPHPPALVARIWGFFLALTLVSVTRGCNSWIHLPKNIPCDCQMVFPELLKLES